MSLSRSSGTDDAMTYMVCGFFMVLVLAVSTGWCEEHEYDDEAGDDKEGGLEDGDAYGWWYDIVSHEWQQSHCAYSEDDEDSCDEVVCCFGIHVHRIVAMVAPMTAPNATPMRIARMSILETGSDCCFMVDSE